MKISTKTGTNLILNSPAMLLNPQCLFQKHLDMAGDTVGISVPWNRSWEQGSVFEVAPALPLQRWDDPDERAVPVPPSHTSSLRLPAARGGRLLVQGSYRACGSLL